MRELAREVETRAPRASVEWGLVSVSTPWECGVPWSAGGFLTDACGRHILLLGFQVIDWRANSVVPSQIRQLCLFCSLKICSFLVSFKGKVTEKEGDSEREGASKRVRVWTDWSLIPWFVSPRWPWCQDTGTPGSPTWWPWPRDGSHLLLPFLAQ